MKCEYCDRHFEKPKSMTNHRRWHKIETYKIFQDKFRKDISKINSAENNGNWKGDNVKYRALHEWVRNHKSEPALCVECEKQPPYDLANISGEYKRNLDDWEYLCRKCHMIKDGRLKKLMRGLNHAMP